jgi:hypothetical protein
MTDMAAERATPRRGMLVRGLRWAWLAGLALLAALVVGLVLYRFVPVPSTLMLGRWLTLQPVERQWVPLSRISPNLIRAVIAAEDQRFCSHDGVDWVELNAVLDDEDGPSRGASTLTMQTAKNVFLWPWRSTSPGPSSASSRSISTSPNGATGFTVRRLRPSAISASRPRASPPQKLQGLPARCPIRSCAIRRGRAGACNRRPGASSAASGNWARSAIALCRDRVRHGTDAVPASERSAVIPDKPRQRRRSGIHRSVQRPPMDSGSALRLPGMAARVGSMIRILK